jgi:hypothetical protein
VVVDSLKALDPNRPIREADISGPSRHFAFVPIPDIVMPFARPSSAVAFERVDNEIHLRIAPGARRPSDGYPDIDCK